MATNTNTSMALFLALNLVFLTVVNACGTCPSPISKTKPQPHPNNTPVIHPTCPIDTLKLGVCANLLGGLLGLTIGNPPKTPCCTLIEGLADLEVAACLCTALKANVLGNNLNIPLSLTLLLNVCGKKVPSGFKCDKI